MQDWKKRSRVRNPGNKMAKNKRKAVEDPLPADVGEDDELDDPPLAPPNPQVFSFFHYMLATYL